MEFPARSVIRNALLVALADGVARDSDDVQNAVADLLGLSEAQRRAPAGNGNGTRLGDEIDWIKGAGDNDLRYFDRVGPKLYRLTPAGQNAAASITHPDGSTRSVPQPLPPMPSDLDQFADQDVETLRRDPGNLAALNRTARRYLALGNMAKDVLCQPPFGFEGVSGVSWS